jgi:hypothetical protein
MPARTRNAKKDSAAGQGGKYQKPDRDPRGAYVLVTLTIPSRQPALVFEYHGHLPPTGRCWRFTAARLAELEAEGRIVVPKHGLPRMKRYLAETPSNEP